MTELPSTITPRFGGGTEYSGIDLASGHDAGQGGGLALGVVECRRVSVRFAPVQETYVIMIDAIWRRSSLQWVVESRMTRWRVSNDGRS